MKKSEDSEKEMEDVVAEEGADDFEPEEGEGESVALRAKLKKLREELEKAKKERQEYLDGWQRCRADSANAVREAQERIVAARASGREHLILDLIPALDAFDMAMQSEGWGKVDGTWRSGIEYIRSQIESALRASGVEPFGESGEAFDPARHEIVSEEESDGEPHRVLRVVRKGYASGARVLRPAHVVVSK